MNLFALNSEENVYRTIIDGVEFVCEGVKPEFEKAAPMLAQAYHEKLPQLVTFIMGEVTEMFGYVTEDEVKDALGAPQIDLDRNVVTYLEQSLDDSHIIEIEFDGLFEEFYGVSIDG